MNGVEIHHGFATIGDCKIHFVEAGATNAKVLVLLHGFPDFWYSWRHQIQGLSRDFHVIAIDQRGYNLSDKPLKISDYSIDVLVNDVKQFVKQLGLGKFVLVGHDWGGAIAWEFANRYPELLSGLVVINCPPLKVLFAEQFHNGKQLKSSYYVYLFQLPLLPELMLSRNHAALVAFVLSGPGMNPRITRSEIQAYRKEFGSPGAIRPGINYYRSALRQFLPRYICGSMKQVSIHVSTCVIWGVRDGALQASLTRKFPALCKNGYQIHYIKAGHFVHQEKPGTVNALIRKFCNELA
ncbi:MAG TPA: alpha/beta hydrolase [Candidatus Lokiarchaeia archaeon]|nr:alpha/beta hydrolase [Candidatus Lokiarchaeia archaeon]